MFRLPRLNIGAAITDANGKPTGAMVGWWQTVVQQIETAIKLIVELTGIQDEFELALQQAQQATADAQAAAAAAQQASDAAAKETSLQGSYPTNFVDPLVSADSTGAVTIAAHDRVYGNSTLNPTVSVDGGTVLTGYAPGEVARIFYDDLMRAGGAVTYQYTIDPAVAVQTGNRHSVGAVTIPDTGSNDGRELRPPGYVEV